MSGRYTATIHRNPEDPSRRISIVLNSPEGTAAAAEAPPLSKIDRAPTRQFSAILKELDRMIGLENVKKLIYEIYALLLIKQYRAEAGLHYDAHVYHMVFKGNPGTGKTTVARIVAKLLHELGVLSKGHLIEVDRAELVGEYIGHTALKTKELIKKAMGGALFIDEAYSLARGGDKDFGKEAIDTLVKAMEDYKNQFVLILAGYPDEMDEFMRTNPGLPSRFPIQVDFPDYTVEQLMQIAHWMMKEREYSFHPQAEWKLRQYLTREIENSFGTFSNARLVRNLIEKAMRHQAVRLLQLNKQHPSRQELMTLRPEDLRLDRA